MRLGTANDNVTTVKKLLNPFQLVHFWWLGCTGREIKGVLEPPRLHHRSVCAFSHLAE